VAKDLDDLEDLRRHVERAEEVLRYHPELGADVSEELHERHLCRHRDGKAISCNMRIAVTTMCQSLESTQREISSSRASAMSLSSGRIEDTRTLISSGVPNAPSAKFSSLRCRAKSGSPGYARTHQRIS
jgi:hypothetical protein